MLKAKLLVVASFISVALFAGEALAELKIGYVNTQRLSLIHISEPTRPY